MGFQSKIALVLGICSVATLLNVDVGMQYFEGRSNELHVNPLLKIVEQVVRLDQMASIADSRRQLGLDIDEIIDGIRWDDHHRSLEKLDDIYEAIKDHCHQDHGIDCHNSIELMEDNLLEAYRLLETDDVDKVTARKALMKVYRPIRHFLRTNHLRQSGSRLRSGPIRHQLGYQRKKHFRDRRSGYEPSAPPLESAPDPDLNPAVEKKMTQAEIVNVMMEKIEKSKRQSKDRSRSSYSNADDDDDNMTVEVKGLPRDDMRKGSKAPEAIKVSSVEKEEAVQSVSTSSEPEKSPLKTEVQVVSLTEKKVRKNVRLPKATAVANDDEDNPEDAETLFAEDAEGTKAAGAADGEDGKMVATAAIATNKHRPPSKTNSIFDETYM